MKILIYCGYQPDEWTSLDLADSNLGGSEKCTLELFHRLRAMDDHDVTLVGHGIGDNFNDINCIDYNSFQYRNKGHHYDVVIAVNYAHYFLELDPIISFDTSHFWLHNEEPFSYYRGEIMADPESIYHNPRLTKIICVSEFAHNQLIDRVDEDVAHKVDWIPNGIDYGQTRTVGEKIPNSFIYTSCPTRGLDEALDVFDRMKSILPDATFHLCHPSYAEDAFFEYEAGKIADIIAKHGEDCISMYGPLIQSDLYDLMSNCEYWLYPSDYNETFCITALEMMAHRVLAVTCPAGNVGNLVTDHNGISIPYSEDRAQLVSDAFKAIIWHKQQPNVIDAKLSEAQSLSQQYDWNNVVVDWNDLISNSKKVNIDGEVPFEAVYIIGLDRTANWDEIAERVESLNLPENVQIHYHSAVDGRTINMHELANAGYTLFPWKMQEGETENGWFLRDMVMGEIGCAVSHHQCWVDAKNHNYDGVLILEEDFNVLAGTKDFNFDSIPNDWDMFYLGRNAFGGDDIEQINEDVCIPFWSYNAHAYMFSKKGLDSVLNEHFENNLMPVDEYLLAFWLNTAPRNDILDTVKNKLNVYAIPQHNQDLIGQTSMTGVNSTTEGNGHDKLHPDLYTFWSDRDAWVRRFMSPGIAHKEWDLMVDEPMHGVLTMPLFTEEFCLMIREEAEHAKAWTTDRHEFYPTTDMLLQQIDMHDIYMEVLRMFVMPMAQHVWALEGEGWDNLNAENFLARYIPEAQGHLSLHHDNADITALINLSKEDVDYEGGGTFFDRAGAVHRGKMGHVSVHPGRITHRHGARPVTKGSRYIVVSFMTNPALSR